MEYRLCDDTWDSKELEAVERVIESNRFSMGKEVEAYEAGFAKKFGTKYAVMSNSGSSANLLAIAALVYSGRLKKGDEVIVPAVSWSTTYFPVAQLGLKLVFVDIDLQTLNIDVEQMESAVSDRTKAVFCVNLLGNPNKYDEIISICNKYNMLLIEDNCESLGGKYQTRHLGTIGVIGTYSTFYSHHLCTMEGGMTVTEDEELYHYMLCIRAHGWTRNLPQKSSLYEKSEDRFYESFNFIMPGFNLRPLEMEGAIGIEQLKKMDNIIEQRRENAKYFLQKIEELQGVSTQKEVSLSSWFGFAIILTGHNQGKRDRLVKKMEENSIEVRPIVAGNFTRSKAMEYLDYRIYGNLVNADNIHENGFFVGNHSRENTKQIDSLVNIMRKELINH